MKINPKLSIRSMMGENVVIMQGAGMDDMTRVITLNKTSKWLWEKLYGRDFEIADVAALLTERFDVDEQTAEKDAAGWTEKLSGCGVII